MPNLFDSCAALCDRSCRHVFGEPVTLISPHGELEVTGLVTQENVEIESLGHPSIQAQSVSVEVRRSDFEREPKVNDRVRVKGSIYNVINVKPDMHGGIKLILMKGL